MLKAVIVRINGAGGTIGTGSTFAIATKRGLILALKRESFGKGFTEMSIRVSRLSVSA